MQFRIRTAGTTPDLAAIEAAIADVDPAAVLDLDPAGGTLRISAALGDAELLALVRQAGYPVSERQLERVPSECCGGCGG